MRLDEAGRDAEVCLDPPPVQPHRHLGAERPDPGQRRFVTRIVVLDLDAADDVGTEHLEQLGAAVPAMRAGRDEHDDVLEADDPLELGKDGGYHDVARLRPRSVADADRNRLARPHEIAQRGARDRVAERRGDGAAGVSGGGEMPRRNHDRAVAGNVDRETRVAVGELHLHATQYGLSALERGCELPATPCAGAVRDRS